MVILGTENVSGLRVGENLFSKSNFKESFWGRRCGGVANKLPVKQGSAIGLGNEGRVWSGKGARGGFNLACP